MPSHCFTQLLSNSPENSAASWCDRVLQETKNFIVIASIGAIVPGWLLIVPKRRLANMSLLTATERQELVWLRERVSSLMATNGLPVFEFEHGDFVGGPHGCGVDQAHLHIVPLSFDLISIAKQTEPALQWKRQDAPLSWTGNRNPYLYVGTPNEYGYIAYPEEPKSQWFRKIIAAESGLVSCWDYKKFPFFRNVAHTIEKFGNISKQLVFEVGSPSRLAVNAGKQYSQI
jgi:ATP adenylyltransferase